MFTSVVLFQTFTKMPKTREISVEVRQMIVDDHESGLGYRKIAEKYNKSKATTKSIIQKLKKTKSVLNKTRSGRPPKTTSREDKRIVREVKRESVVSARAIKEKLSMNVSERTIQRRLRSAGFYGSRVTKKNLHFKKK